MKLLFPLPRVSSRSVTNLRQTQKGFWAVRRGFVCFRQLCRCETWKVQLGLDPDETGRVQWCEGVSAHCSRDTRTSQTTRLYLLSRLQELIWFWYNFELSKMLIAPWSITILRLDDIQSFTKLLLCCERIKLPSTMQTSLWLLSVFDFCFKNLFYLFYWFQLCLLIYTHRHQIPLRTALSELIGSDFLFILTMGELHCWLNSWLSWMELFAEHSR